MNSNFIIPNKSERTVLFVSELPENITENDLEVFFQDYKDNILMIQINRSNKVMDYYYNKSLSATVIFKDNKKADEARKGLNMRKIRGKTIRIMWHEKDNRTRYNNQGNLFVKSIPIDMKPREFYELFDQFGDILSAKLNEDDEGNHLGYGYVNYYNKVDAESALRELNEKEISGEKLEVSHFQKKNERQFGLNMNRNLYVKNIPEHYTESSIKSLFATYGTITWTKVYVDEQNRKSAIVSFDSEESANNAKELNNTEVENMVLFVDTHQKKSDRKKVLTSKINDINSQLNSLFLDCNLHVRNLPFDMTEGALKALFSKYGEIKSVKIPQILNVIKVGTEIKETLISKGFGYVCFADSEAAKTAKEELNGQTVYNSKRPLLIDFFMPKYERKQILSKIQNQYLSKPMPLINPMFDPMKMKKHPAAFKPVIPTHHNIPVSVPVQKHSKQDDIDIKYLQSLENDSKKDYLGEILFKKIENHPIASNNNLTIDVIGKITGMILGIEDINEIVEIIINEESLYIRITEAITLLESQ
jgi:RNA recognition motif-containing protein